jgi:hypothetical protein
MLSSSGRVPNECSGYGDAVGSGGAQQTLKRESLFVKRRETARTTPPRGQGACVTERARTRRSEK